MRAVLIGDVIAAARALLAISPAARFALLERLLTEAHAAHKFYKRKHRPHPKWGNGSLMARANRCRQIAEPFWGSADWLFVLNFVVVGVIERQRTGGRR